MKEETKTGNGPAPTGPVTKPGAESPPSSGGGEGSESRPARPNVGRRGSVPGVKRGPYNWKHRKVKRREPGSLDKEVATVKAKSIAGTIKLVHEMIAAIPGFECMELDNEEAKRLGDLAKEYGEHYPNVKLSPKVAFWVTAMSTLGVVYGPRIAVIRMEMKERAERQRAAARPKATVTPIRKAPEPEAGNVERPDVEPGPA